MIISDLEILETASPNICFDSYSIRGGMFIQPIINFESLVMAFNEFPGLGLIMDFSGEVAASDHAFMKVDQRGIVKNLGFGNQIST